MPQVATVTAYFTYWAVIAILFAGYYIYGKRHPEPFEDVEAKKVVEMDSGNVLEPSLDGYGE